MRQQITHRLDGTPIVRKKRASPEMDLQKSVVRWLRYVLPVGSIVSATVNEMPAGSNNEVSRMRFGQRRKAAGIHSGMPDLSAFLHGGRTVFIEMKAPGGRLSDMQEETHARLGRLGFAVCVAYSIDDVRAFLRREGVPIREVG